MVIVLLFLWAVALVIGALAGSAALFAAPVIGASFIRWVVRQINRRDDPRCIRPPDYPP